MQSLLGVQVYFSQQLVFQGLCAGVLSLLVALLSFFLPCVSAEDLYLAIQEAVQISCPFAFIRSLISLLSPDSPFFIHEMQHKLHAFVFKAITAYTCINSHIQLSCNVILHYQLELFLPFSNFFARFQKEKANQSATFLTTLL